ncbi:potassium channel protein [archaeon SCG-AAA382B04]|nr:potassium channel protein [archaeon SCG-AAA382B04]
MKEPTSVKERLTEMKDVSELILDLSYSAALFDHKAIAEEVSRLEDKMDQLIYEIRISAILGARNRDAAEKMSGVLQIAEAAEKISNASGDIANIVLEDIELPPEFKGYLTKAEELITKKKVSNGSGENKSLGELKLESRTGFRVIAIRRGENWIYNPNKKTVLEKNDIVIARGPFEGVKDFHKMITGEEIEPDVESIDSGRSYKAGEIAMEMKNISELATDLAYSAILLYNEEISQEVKQLEEEMDSLNNKLEMWVLRSAKQYEGDELDSLSGLLRLGRASEVVSDAAMEMADVVLRGIELHPILALAIRESKDIITRLEVKEESEVVGKKIGDLSIKTKTGMHIMAVRRKNSWIYNPSARTELEKGDIIISKGTREGEKRLKKLVT